MVYPYTKNIHHLDLVPHGPGTKPRWWLFPCPAPHGFPQTKTRWQALTTALSLPLSLRQQKTMTHKPLKAWPHCDTALDAGLNSVQLLPVSALALLTTAPSSSQLFFSSVQTWLGWGSPPLPCSLQLPPTPGLLFSTICLGQVLDRQEGNGQQRMGEAGAGLILTTFSVERRRQKCCMFRGAHPFFCPKPHPQ